MKTIKFNSYNNEKFEIGNVPDTARVYLDRINDKVDGESTLMVIQDGDQTLAIFRSIVSFYVSSLDFKSLTGSKDFI